MVVVFEVVAALEGVPAQDLPVRFRDDARHELGAQWHDGGRLRVVYRGGTGLVADVDV